MREKINLDRDWRFIRDELDLRDRYKGLWDAYNTNRTGRRCNMATAKFDDSSWMPVTLPHDWMVGEPFSAEYLAAAGYKRRGIAWYRREMTLSEDHRGKHILLVFEGVANSCEVYFNGSLLARNHSAYNEFTVDLTDRFLFGVPNVLAVRVDGRNVENWSYEGAGIYRHVWLLVKDEIHIAQNSIFVRPTKKEEDEWEVTTELSVENSGYTCQDITVELAVTAPDGSNVVASQCVLNVQADCENPIRLCLAVHAPALWDCDHPHLYSAVCKLAQNGKVLDEETVTFGFRTIAVSANEGFFLNGKHMKIHGVCCHQDHAGVGVAVPDSIVAYRIRKLKEAGFNAYRSVHHPASRIVLEECDRQGMLVMDENTHFESSREVLEQLEFMVRHDRNHPSVVFYSLFNEQPLAAEEPGGRVFRRLKSAVKKLDDTRLITGAMTQRTMFGEDGAALNMDITGFNYSLSYLEEFHQKYPEQPVMGTENDATYGTRGFYTTDMSLRRIASDDTQHEPYFNSIRETVAVFRRLSWTIGYFLWCGFDYRGEPLPMAWPAVSSQFGIMDTCGIPKGGFWFYKAVRGQEPVIHLAPHWNQVEGESVRVLAITNCTSAELFLNNQSLGRRETVDFTVEWESAFVPGLLKVVGYIGDKPVAEDCRKTAGAPAAICMHPDRIEISGDGADTVPVNVCVVDTEGNIVPNADTLIRFSIEGEGVILGCGNGDPTSHELDNLPQRRLFSGWCHTLVRCEPGARSLKLKAAADSVAGATIDFTIC